MNVVAVAVSSSNNNNYDIDRILNIGGKEINDVFFWLGKDKTDNVTNYLTTAIKGDSAKYEFFS